LIDADPIDQAIKLRINNAIGDTIGPSAVLLIIAGIIKRATNGATKKDPIMKSMLFKKPAYRNDHIKIDRERIIITICIKRKNLPPFAPLNIPGLLYSGIIGLIDMSAKPWNREARIIIKLALISLCLPPRISPRGRGLFFECHAVTGKSPNRQ